MRPGDVVRLRESHEPLEVVALLDASGTLLVRSGEDVFEVARNEVATPRELNDGCACCP